jgi:hypothetical protein
MQIATGKHNVFAPDFAAFRWPVCQAVNDEAVIADETDLAMFELDRNPFRSLAGLAGAQDRRREHGGEYRFPC